MRLYENILLLFIVLFLWSCNEPGTEKDETAIPEKFDKAHAEFLHQSNPDSALKLSKSATQYGLKHSDFPLVFESMMITAYVYSNKQMNDSVKLLMKQMLHLAEKRNDSHYLASANQMIASAYFNENKLDSSLFYIKKGLSIAIKIKDEKNLPALYTSMGEHLHKTLQFDSSFYYYQHAIDLYKKENHAVNIAILYTMVANLYADQKLPEKAEQYLRRSIKIDDSLHNDADLTNNYNNLGILFKNNNQYDSATFYLKKAIELSHKSGDSLGVIIETYNLGNVYTHLRNYSAAKEALTQVYNYCKKNKLPSGMVKAYSGLAENEIKNLNYKLAKEYLEKALQLAKEIDEIQDQRNILSQLIKLHFLGSGDSLNLFNQYKIISDSILKTNYIKEIAATETKYAVKLKDKSIENLHIKNRQKDYQIFILLFSVTFIILGTVVLYIMNKLKVKNLTKENELLQEKQKNQQLLLQRAELNLKLKQQQITSKALSMAEYEGDFSELANELYLFKDKLRNINDRKKFESLLYTFKKSKFKNPLEEFEIAFMSIYPKYINQLLLKYPDLSPREVQICTMIKLNLQTKQIAILTNNTTKSTETTRYRIRKKMKLTENQNLNSELKKF